jgi:hypothetical protein
MKRVVHAVRSWDSRNLRTWCVRELPNSTRSSCVHNQWSLVTCPACLAAHTEASLTCRHLRYTWATVDNRVRRVCRDCAALLPVDPHATPVSLFSARRIARP